MVWNSPRLAAKMHSIPHVNIFFEPVIDDFDFDSADYKISLLMIGLIPLLSALIILVVLFIYWVWRLLVRVDIRTPRRKITDEPCEETGSCVCQRQVLMLLLIFTTLVILIFALIFEFVLHSRFMEVTSKLEQTLYLSSDAIDLTNYPKRISDNFTNSLLAFNHPLVKFGESTFYKDLNATLLKRYRRVYGTFADDILTMLSRIENPLEQYAPLRLHCKLASTLKVREYIRYVFSLIGWMLGIVIPFMVLVHRWKAMLAGILWFVVMGGWLLSASVALGDLCQHNPADFVDKSMDVKAMNQEVLAKKRFLCNKFNDQVEKNIDDFKKRYDEWGVAFDEMLRKHRNTYRDKTDEYLKANNSIYNYLSAINNSLTTNIRNNTYDVLYRVPRVTCGVTSRLGYQDVPAYDARALCVGDNVLFWMVVQLYLVLFIGLGYVYMLLLYISMLRDISFYVGADQSSNISLLKLETNALLMFKNKLRLTIERYLLGLKPCPQPATCVSSGLICRTCQPPVPLKKPVSAPRSV